MVAVVDSAAGAEDLAGLAVGVRAAAGRAAVGRLVWARQNAGSFPFGSAQGQDDKLNL